MPSFKFRAKPPKRHKTQTRHIQFSTPLAPIMPSLPPSNSATAYQRPIKGILKRNRGSLDGHVVEGARGTYLTGVSTQAFPATAECLEQPRPTRHSSNFLRGILHPFRSISLRLHSSRLASRSTAADTRPLHEDSRAQPLTISHPYPLGSYHHHSNERRAMSEVDLTRRHQHHRRHRPSAPRSQPTRLMSDASSRLGEFRFEARNASRTRYP